MRPAQHPPHPPLWLNGLCGVAWLASLVWVSVQLSGDISHAPWAALLFAVTLVLTWVVLRQVQAEFARIALATQAMTWSLLVVSTAHGLLSTNAEEILLQAVWLFGMVCLCALLYREQHQRAGRMEESGDNALEEASRRLQAAQAHRDTFLAAVSHELRTPMNAILGLNGTLRAQLADSPQDAAVVDLIRTSTERLLQVVNNILDFSRLQAQRLKLVPEPVPLDGLLQSCVQSFEVAARSKGLTLVLQAQAAQGVWVQADPKRLQQIVHHLLDNAIRFTHQGIVTLRASRQNGLWRFEVQDTGMGLNAERQAQLFQAALKSEEAQPLTDGTGLGLAICEQLVRLQRGQIGAHSQAGQGACFWFALPLPAAVPPTRASENEAAAWRKHPWRMLVVDDNELNRVVATLLLKKQCPNAIVTTSGSASEALDVLQTQPFDVVWMDIVMPEMDGMMATRQLRAQPGPNAQTPVLAMTAVHQPEDRAACLAAGMQGMVSKPLQPNDLLQALADIATHHLPTVETQHTGGAA